MAGSVGKKASSFVASDPDKKRLAEKSFTSYVRAVQLMPNKQVRLLLGCASIILLVASVPSKRLQTSAEHPLSLVHHTPKLVDSQQQWAECLYVTKLKGHFIRVTWCLFWAERPLPPRLPASLPLLQAFRVSELLLEEYAFSLGLAAAPRVPGLEKALERASSAGVSKQGGGGGSAGDDGAEDGAGTENEKQREEARAKKNVNRSLQRLKEQIKAEKLRKRMEVTIL